MADLNAAYIMHVGQCGIVNKARMLHVHNHGKLSFLAHMSHLIQTVTSLCDNSPHGVWEQNEWPLVRKREIKGKLSRIPNTSQVKTCATWQMSCFPLHPWVSARRRWQMSCLHNQLWAGLFHTSMPLTVSAWRHTPCPNTIVLDDTSSSTLTFRHYALEHEYVTTGAMWINKVNSTCYRRFCMKRMQLHGGTSDSSVHSSLLSSCTQRDTMWSMIACNTILEKYKSIPTYGLLVWLVHQSTWTSTKLASITVFHTLLTHSHLRKQFEPPCQMHDVAMRYVWGWHER